MLAATPSRELYLAADCRRDWDFPSGCYEFMGGEEAECGAYQFCSLFSPAFDFCDQDSAVATADEIMRGLFTGVAADAGPQLEAARMAGHSLMEVPTTRRGFLKGVLGSRRA
jgi:[NiFe] hydrogenase assembly HybE family chaperone